jgi:hypothetical protein
VQCHVIRREPNVTEEHIASEKFEFLRITDITIQETIPLQFIFTRPVISRRMRDWGEKRNTYSLLVGKKERKRPRLRWVDNINMDLLETGWGGVNWIGLVQDRDKWRALVNVVMKFWVP